MLLAMPTQPMALVSVDPAQILLDVFGYPAFRGPQEAIVRHAQFVEAADSRAVGRQ